MLEHAPENKFTVWQAHWSVITTNILIILEELNYSSKMDEILLECHSYCTATDCFDM